MSTASNAIPSSRDTAHLLLRDLPPHLAARRRGLHTKAPVWNLVCVFYPLAWIATAAAVERLTAGREGVLAWLVRITGAALIGAFIQAIAILMHEALHGNLFRSTRLNYRAELRASKSRSPVIYSGVRA